MLRDLTLDALGPSDEHPLAALFAANDVPEVTRWFDPFPLSPETARTLSRHEGRDLYWCARCGTGVVGLAMVRGWDGGHPYPAYGCLVDSRWHRQGIGTSVTSLVLDDLRLRRVPEVRARVHDDNTASLRMLTAAGYEELERGAGRLLMVARPGSLG
jgi:RimJ/RimL family protein N-acetyltransferase